MKAVQHQRELERPAGATPIDAGAAENLRYIRRTIEAANTFTMVPGKGCLVMGAAGLGAAVLELLPATAPYWLPIWLTAAVFSVAAALFFMELKARSQGLSLRRAVASKFFLTLAPGFVVGAVLTAALLDTAGRDVIAGVWLLNYGASLGTCGVFSIPAVLITGGAFMCLGAITLVAPPAWAPAMLALGFGGLHILLGIVILKEHGG